MLETTNSRESLLGYREGVNFVPLTTTPHYHVRERYHYQAMAFDTAYNILKGEPKFICGFE